MYSGTQMGWIIACAALACIAFLLAGMWIGYGRGEASADTLVRNLEGELDARKRVPPRQLRHRKPAAELRPEPAQPDGDTAIMERLAPTAYIQTPDWGAEWDLDGFLARLTADNDQFLTNLMGDSQ
jgi:hypothetical protein